MTKESAAIMVFEIIYLKKEICCSSKTDLHCESTQNPENPREAEIIESFKTSFKNVVEIFLIPVVISSTHRTIIVTTFSFFKDTVTNFEITEKIIM